MGEIKAAEKLVKKTEAAAKRAAKPKGEAGMTAAEFKKLIKGAAADWKADFAGQTEMDLGDVVWDMADSMLYDKSLEDYVRKLMSKNSGRKPEQISRDSVRDYVANEIYNAG